ncbi:adventurous gliding motility lipoprotein CglD [Aggregicoccus sp. 17bor-14]|uniref:adventurous gliding motility lipoprotein CglC n=1 Tax=Myxococcaceae TaxID=31 RepID=UPI00129C2A94|nr:MULTISPECIES: adventurous gliding motility lipoprotein CglC [Myxococcaceae]MBF5044932.1 adventurous gliding motility lipoprotein CglD [Simulacricoccus sp. 17bor-14]MRI90675.1 adventurous gliding motility lipoprotein CglD [Aggregicoccus sp. 17bor-14]
MPRRSLLVRTLGALILSPLLLTACTDSTEIGKKCQLVKKDPNGVAPFAVVLNSELVAGQDFISFGASDCVELICVHDKDSPVVGGPNDPATGYCSEACIPGGATCDTVSGEASADLKERMECRALLLDQTTLDRLRQEDPAAYRNTFGENTNPYFCAGAPPVVDAGS